MTTTKQSRGASVAAFIILALLVLGGYYLVAHNGVHGEPGQSTVCGGHGTVVMQHSVNDYRTEYFTGWADCSDGQRVYYIDGNEQ